MAYQPRTANAPRTAGWTLKALARVVENPAGAALLGRTLLESADIPAFREAIADDPPWPLGSPRRVDAPAPPDGPPADLADLDPGGAPAPGAGNGLATAAEYAAAYREGRADPEGVAQAVLEACRAAEQADPPLRAIVAQDAADVLAQARASAGRFRQGVPLGPLDGVPVAIKDELDQPPYPTTVGTAFLKEVPARDATVVARLRAAGALLIGKANMHRSASASRE